MGSQSLCVPVLARVSGCSAFARRPAVRIQSLCSCLNEVPVVFWRVSLETETLQPHHRHLLEPNDNQHPVSWVLRFLLSKMSMEPFSFQSCLGADAILTGMRVIMGKSPGPVCEGFFFF